MASIELENVDVRYGSLKALDGISCTVAEGVTGLLGPNGAGKSTLLKVLLGFNRAVSGTVRVFGLEMPRNALEVRSRLGYMPEREVVSPRVSAVAFLTFCGRLSGMSRVDAMERTHEVLNYVGIDESRYRMMETCSTGMLQRIKLAQALLHDPDLLLLDEPTNGLDPDGRIEVLNLIGEIAASRRITILLSSHLLPDVQHVSERVLMIDRGRVVREGALAALTAPREGEFEVRVRENKAAFLNAVQAAGCAWRNQPDGNLRITLAAGMNAETLFRMAAESGTAIRHLEAARGNLEDAFMQAVRGGESMMKGGS
jgi:ABC-2 type transport system ATP-binding protein